MNLNKESSCVSIWKALFILPFVGISLVATAKPQIDYPQEDQQPFISTLKEKDNYIIYGEAGGIDNGVILDIFLNINGYSEHIATDTVKNGQFYFEIPSISEEIIELIILPSTRESTDIFPPCFRTLYVKPGCTININADSPYANTWRVSSDIPENISLQGFTEHTKDIEIEFAKNHMERQKYSALIKESSGEIREAYRKRHNELVTQFYIINDMLEITELNYMKSAPQDKLWWERLYSHCKNYRNRTDDFPYKYGKELLELYDSLKDKKLDTDCGKAVKTLLYPEQKNAIGDPMPEAILYDLYGKTHSLSEFSGKYLLLDFWRAGCKPCIKAFKEMKQIADQFKDEISIVSISTDPEKAWRIASAKHDISWNNWNELCGESGLYSKYHTIGVPHYVLISPNGIILDEWPGYSPGSLIKKMNELIVRP